MGSCSLDGSSRRLTFRVTVTVCAAAAEAQSISVKPAASPAIRWDGKGMAFPIDTSSDSGVYASRQSLPEPQEAPMRRRVFLYLSLLVFLGAAVGDGVIYAATCTPLAQGTCHACKNCKYCGHCAKNGGKCSVCR
jgi:hypothetical protein